MLKTLLKKQWAEWVFFFTMDRAKNKRRTPTTIFAFAVLMVYVLFSMVYLIWELTATLCEPFVKMDMSWVYFSLMGIMATSIGVVFCAFFAKSKLYDAKDNDTLLSMPIPTWMILISRLIELYVFAFVVESVVLFPTVVRYLTVAGMDIGAIFGCIWLCFLLPFVSVALCCIFGWLLALVMGKLPTNNLVNVVFSLAFIGVYFWVTTQVNTWITFILSHPTEVQTMLKTKLYPFWQMGLAAGGNILSLLIVTGICLAVFALIYLLISKTYLSILITKKGGRTSYHAYKEKGVSSPFMALFRKEWRRLIKSYGYLLNCGLGSFMIVGAGIYSLIDGSIVGLNADMVAAFGLTGEKSVYVVALGICLLSMMNMLTAPSISLEGENIWILQTSPLSAWMIFQSKIALHLALTLPAALFLGIVFSMILQTGAISVLAILLGFLVVTFSAVFGLIFNLKFPNLHWTNETVVVKQGVSTMLMLLVNFAVVLLMIGGYFLFGKYLSAWLYLMICMCLVAAAVSIGVRWLKEKGAKIFSTLS